MKEAKQSSQKWYGVRRISEQQKRLQKASRPSYGSLLLPAVMHLALIDLTNVATDRCIAYSIILRPDRPKQLQISFACARSTSHQSASRSIALRITVIYACNFTPTWSADRLNS